MKLPIVLGTARIGRQSEKVAKFILAESKKLGFESEILDVRDFRIEVTDNSGILPQAQKLKEIINNCESLIIVLPEYNNSFPGELKMMLDMLYEDWFGKKVGLIGVSAGNNGGKNAAEQLKNVINRLKMIPVAEMYFSNINTHLLNNIEDVKLFLEKLA